MHTHKNYPAAVANNHPSVWCTRRCWLPHCVPHREAYFITLEPQLNLQAAAFHFGLFVSWLSFISQRGSSLTDSCSGGNPCSFLCARRVFASGVHKSQGRLLLRARCMPARSGAHTLVNLHLHAPAPKTDEGFALANRQMRGEPRLEI